jgi:peptidoglycan hydrolase-like protein with peptidoglycan-binding domain
VPRLGRSIVSERLAHGDQGEWVEYLQQVLASKGIDPGAVDGVFGGALDGKVREYQADHGLVVDGVVDARTWESLTGGPAADTAPATTEASVSWDWSRLPLLSTLARYPADDDGARQFLRDHGVDIDLLTTEA